MCRALRQSTADPATRALSRKNFGLVCGGFSLRPQNVPISAPAAYQTRRLTLRYMRDMAACSG